MKDKSGVFVFRRRNTPEPGKAGQGKRERWLRYDSRKVVVVKRGVGMIRNAAAVRVEWLRSAVRCAKRRRGGVTGMFQQRFGEVKADVLYEQE